MPVPIPMKEGEPDIEKLKEINEMSRQQKADAVVSGDKSTSVGAPQAHTCNRTDQKRRRESSSPDGSAKRLHTLSTSAIEKEEKFTITIKDPLENDRGQFRNGIQDTPGSVIKRTGHSETRNGLPFPINPRRELIIDSDKRARSIPLPERRRREADTIRIPLLLRPVSSDSNRSVGHRTPHYELASSDNESYHDVISDDDDYREQDYREIDPLKVGTNQATVRELAKLEKLCQNKNLPLPTCDIDQEIIEKITSQKCTIRCCECEGSTCGDSIAAKQKENTTVTAATDCRRLCRKGRPKLE